MLIIFATTQELANVRQLASERGHAIREQVDSWETEIAAKLGDLGGICNGIVSGDVGTSDACVNQNRSRNARFGATFDTDLKPASTDDTCFDSTPRVGRTLLVHLARVQRVRTCFEDAVQRVQERWQGRLSQMGEILAGH